MKDLKQSVTNDEFYAALVSIIEETTVSELFQIPGFYELVSEEFNNDALVRARTRKELV